MSIYSPFEKRSVFEDLLQGNVVSIVLDGSHSGVQLPDHLLGNDEVRLNISYGFALPILDITIKGIEAELSFNGSGFLCFLPWDAIYYMQTIEGPDDRHFTDLGSMPLRMRDKVLESIGLSTEDFDELKWDATDELEELEDDDSSDDGCIDFVAFLEKKKAEEES